MSEVTLSKREASLAGAALLAIGGFVSSLVPHGADANAAALAQQVSVNAADIKTVQSDRDKDRQDQQQFHQEILQRLDTLDGRTVDMYHVVLTMQQSVAAQGAKR